MVNSTGKINEQIISNIFNNYSRSSKMKKGLILTLSFILITVFASCGGGKNVKDDKKSNSTTKEENSNRGQATGYATIYDDDKALARDRAIDDAKNKLVAKILGDTVSGSSLVEDFKLVSSVIEAKSYGLVKNDKIIEEKQDGNAYIVTIEGTVETAAVEDAIKDALNRYGKPKFMILIKETFEGAQNNPGFTVTELKMESIMGELGFDFVDAATTQELMKKDKAKMLKAVSGSVSADVQDLLSGIGADIIITGESKTKDQSAALKSNFGSSNMQSKSAIINIKAIDVYTGKTLASISENAPGLHIEAETASKMAIENCLKKSTFLGKKDDEGSFKSGRFISSIIKKFVEAATEREITVLVAGLSTEELKNFENQLLNRIRGVKKLNEKKQEGKSVNLEVIFSGKTTDFRDELTAKAEKIGFKIDIKSTTPNKLMMNAKKLK